ncbi:MAG TPA: CDP-alcohol phosphatidyltransferase family protein [Gemmatimonadaceae bacterium]|nr:CDP-alcohol phosphatidyltransferase family protein [Gemmatimonadaceae bacterium]
MNLPNSLSAARIATAPFLLVLPFIPSVAMRLLGFVLYIAAAVTDYWDGRLARTRKMETNLGRMLDPLADKILLVATLVPVYLMMQHRYHWLARFLGLEADPNAYPFETFFGTVGLPWWILAAVLGRELFMTLFRTAAARRGVVIAAIGPAKWKTGFQATWIGAAYFWLFASTLAADAQWGGSAWHAFALFNGMVGFLSMSGAVVLTMYSLALYMRRYSYVFARHPTTTR